MFACWCVQIISGAEADAIWCSQAIAIVRVQKRLDFKFSACTFTNSTDNLNWSTIWMEVSSLCRNTAGFFEIGKIAGYCKISINTEKAFLHTGARYLYKRAISVAGEIHEVVQIECTQHARDTSTQLWMIDNTSLSQKQMFIYVYLSWYLGLHK